MANKEYWEAEKKALQGMIDDCDAIITKWIEAHPQWLYEIHFSDYPPKIVLRLGMVAKDQKRATRLTEIFSELLSPVKHEIYEHLSDDNLQELGELTALLCGPYKFRYRKWIRDGVVKYEFWRQQEVVTDG